MIPFCARFAPWKKTQNPVVVGRMSEPCSTTVSFRGTPVAPRTAPPVLLELLQPRPMLDGALPQGHAIASYPGKQNGWKNGGSWIPPHTSPPPAVSKAQVAMKRPGG